MYWDGDTSPVSWLRGQFTEIDSLAWCKRWSPIPAYYSTMGITKDEIYRKQAGFYSINLFAFTVLAYKFTQGSGFQYALGIMAAFVSLNAACCLYCILDAYLEARKQQAYLLAAKLEGRIYTDYDDCLLGRGPAQYLLDNADEITILPRPDGSFMVEERVRKIIFRNRAELVKFRLTA